MPIVAGSAHYSRFADCECRRLQIVVSNCASISTLGASKYLPFDHMTTTSRSDSLIFDAQNELSIFLEELQEGLVVKLLLPTEPTTPTPHLDIFTSRDSCKQNNRFFVRQEECMQETQPILQRFKNLLAYAEPSHYQDQINSPDTVAYTNDQVYSPIYPSTSTYCYPDGASIPRKVYRYDVVARNSYFEPFQLAFPFLSNFPESQFGDNLQPISPICTRDDVTSVQLLSIRMCLSPLSLPSNSHEKIFGLEETEYYPVTLIVDYAINLKGDHDFQMMNAVTQPIATSDTNCEENPYIFGSATITSTSYSDTLSLQLPPRVIEPLLERTLSASIVVLRSELGKVLRKCEVAINLDYEYILTELIKVIRSALSNLPATDVL